jgi:hypothetical protein
MWHGHIARADALDINAKPRSTGSGLPAGETNAPPWPRTPPIEPFMIAYLPVYTVTWHQHDLRCAVLRQPSGRYCVAGTLDGPLTIGDSLVGELPNSGACQLSHALRGHRVWLDVEARDLSEVDMLDLLSLLSS